MQQVSRAAVPGYASTETKGIKNSLRMQMQSLTQGRRRVSLVQTQQTFHRYQRQVDRLDGQTTLKTFLKAQTKDSAVKRPLQLQS